MTEWFENEYDKSDFVDSLEVRFPVATGDGTPKGSVGCRTIPLANMTLTFVKWTWTDAKGQFVEADYEDRLAMVDVLKKVRQNMTPSKIEMGSESFGGEDSDVRKAYASFSCHTANQAVCNGCVKQLLDRVDKIVQGSRGVRLSVADCALRVELGHFCDGVCGFPYSGVNGCFDYNDKNVVILPMSVLATAGIGYRSLLTFPNREFAQLRVMDRNNSMMAKETFNGYCSSKVTSIGTVGIVLLSVGVVVGLALVVIGILVAVKKRRRA